MEATEDDLFCRSETSPNSVEPTGALKSKHSVAELELGGWIQALCFSCSDLLLFLFPCIAGTAQDPKLQTCCMGPDNENKKTAVAPVAWACL